MRFNDGLILESLYDELIEEGLEQKIPKLLNFVPDNVEDKEEYIRWAAKTFDPTKNSAYITWILRLLKKGVLVGEEDGPKVMERLTQFSELKMKPQFPVDKRDINRFKTYGDLAETIDEFSGIKTKGEIKREATEEGIEKVDEYGNTALYIVTTSEAGAKHFRNTEWCVKDPRYFDQYGPPYYMFTENDSPDVLLHLDSNQCMDVRDRPTELNEEQRELMSSEKMTDYVLKEETDIGIDNYFSKIGPGYEDRVEETVIGKIENAINEANEDLEIFTIEQLDSYYHEELNSYTPEAYGGFDYDFSPYEGYTEDKDFLDEIRGILADFYIYPNEDFLYSDIISDDLDSISLHIRYEPDPYGNDDGITGKVEAFHSELSQMENRFDLEEFDEKMKEVMLEKGYLSSEWAKFSDKIDFSQLNLRNFYPFHINMRTRQSSDDKRVYRTDDIRLGEQDFPIRDIYIDYPYEKTTDNINPFHYLVRFVEPLTTNGVHVFIENGNEMKFIYEVFYDEDKNSKQYMKDLKTLKAVDRHFDFYKDQIIEFYQKYVYPYLKRGFETKKEGEPIEWNMDPDLKLPLLKIKSRKESEDQMVMDLHEDRFMRYLLKQGFHL